MSALLFTPARHLQCWAFGAGHLWPVTPVLPLPYHGLYREPVVIPRANVMAFMANELPRLCQAVPFASEITPDLFSTDPGTPVFHLNIQGSPASLAAELHAEYGGRMIVAGAPEIPGAVCVPDPDDLLHFLSRNLPAEQRALARMRAAGFDGARGDTLGHLIGSRAVLNFLGGDLTVLRRHGWRITLEGRIREHFDNLDMAIPVVSIDAAHPDHLTLTLVDQKQVALSWPGMLDPNGGSREHLRRTLAELSRAMNTAGGRSRRYWNATVPGRIAAE